MKKLFILAWLALFLPSLGMSQVKCIQNFYNQHKEEGYLMKMDLGGWLLDLALQGEDTQDLVEKITNVKLLIAGETSKIKREDTKQLLNDIRSESFSDLMQIKEEDGIVHFMVREKGDIITDAVMVAHGDDGMVIIALEGKFTYDDLRKLNLNTDGGSHFKKLPKDRKKIPQA